ncbi:MT-A70 family methyltransferase [Candidatus Bathyarchaeota archaeon]|nr:MT-A70 family methyltransferase [Candidatus Bathyarchaeota archaeon]
MKYRTVVIDPPWKLNCNLKNTKYYRCGKPMPYKLMTDAEILQFPINDFADENCDLFIWATHSKVPVAIQCLNQWGFRYHCILTWDKTNGIGINGFQRKTELVVYGYRGKMGILRTSGHYIPTLFTEKLTTHSTKPKVFYKLLSERTLEPRIDIFARQKHIGFDAWGDEVDESQTYFADNLL